jgi:uncharacterized protein (DUF1499 family)
MWIKLGIAVYIIGVLSSITLCLIGVLGGFFRYLSPDIAFHLYLGGMVLGVLFVLVGLVDTLKNGSSPRTILLLLALIPCSNFVYLLIEGYKYPMINDISTDLEHPPSFVATMKLLDNEGQSFTFPLEFKKEIELFYPDLEVMVFPQISVDDAHIKAVEIVNGLSNWEITANQIGGQETIIEGTVTSGVFGFVDDFVIRIRKPKSSPSAVVDMRSRSRMGKGDFGQNAEHIREFKSLMH